MSLSQAHSHVGPVTLEYSKAHTAGRVDHEVFNDYGFVVRAKAESGEDIHLWLFTYQLKGPEAIIDGDVTQTLLVFGNFSDKEKETISDNSYINKGQNLDDYLPPGTINIKEEKDQVTWSHAGRTYIGKPPIYELSGVHAGVKVDLQFKETGAALFHHGRFEDLPPKEGDAGYLVHTKVTGTIEVQGKTLKIATGYGVHERIFTFGVVPPRIDYMKGRGLNWAHGWSEEFSWYIMSGDIGPFGKGFVNIDGELLVVQGVDKAWINEVDHWLDPKTRQLAPYKWNIWLATSKGRLDIAVTGYGRAFYTWTRAGGTLVVNQYVCDAVSTFTRTDGTVIKAKQMASLEYMRTLYRQPDY